MTYKCYFIIVFLITATFCSGQPVLKGMEAQELVKITEVYSNIPNLSFHLHYTYADSLSSGTVLDSASIDCKINRGKSFMTNSEMEILQGSEYLIYVNKVDSLIFASPTQEYKSVFQAPLMDSSFRKAHVASMNIIAENDSTWKLSVTFQPESQYLAYRMRYDPKTALVKSVNFHVRNANGVYGVAHDHIICATVYMNNYSSATQDPTLFNENRYFYRLNGNLYPQPAWEGYELRKR